MPRLTCLPPIIDKNSRVLILGTMPGAQSLQKQQYYGNPGNSFWRIIYSLYGLPLEQDYAAKVNFIQTKGIALWDVLKECTRAGSSDSKIKDFAANDFKKLLHDCAGVQYIGFSSQKAFQLFDRYVGPSIQDVDKPALTLFVLPSPSGQFARLRFENKLKAWQKIKLYLKD